jgi:tetrahydromethanopterin S-methyltransferase subunit A
MKFKTGYYFGVVVGIITGIILTLAYLRLM